jgi:hypothetical protein
MSSQNFANNLVSVTKLCCPSCWELYQVLEMGGAIRGSHPIVSPIVLPETLPKSVSEAMVTRFRAILSSQLRHLSSPIMVHGHHRNTSESGYSASSSNEGAVELRKACLAWVSAQDQKL